MNKQKFLFYVMTMLSENPKWLGDVLNAIHWGMMNKLDEMDNRNSSLSAAMILICSEYPSMVAIELDRILPGIQETLKTYGNTTAGKKLIELLEKEGKNAD